MKYYNSKIIKGNFEEIIEGVTGLLNEEGFGVLTEIDVKKTLKKKLDVDFKKYVILGACNPHLALQALQSEDKIGILLPCNVIVIDQGEGFIEVAVIEAANMMLQIGNPGLEMLSHEANDRMNRVLAKLK